MGGTLSAVSSRYSDPARAGIKWGLFADCRRGSQRCIGASQAGSEYLRAVKDERQLAGSCLDLSLL
jgi:hypothetical protein